MAKIILVEDDLVVLHKATTALRQNGYEVEEADTLNNFLRLISKPEGLSEYGAVLSDFALRSFYTTGKDVWQGVRMTDDDIPIIGTSSEPEKWQEIKDKQKDEHIHVIPKIFGHWDIPAILAKLQELGITV